MSNWCEVPDDSQSSETLCSNCGSNFGIVSSNGTCSICFENNALMEEIAAIDTNELYASQNDISSGDSTQNLELAADGSAYVGDGAFSVSNFFEITYRCDITDPIKEFFNNLREENDFRTSGSNDEKKKCINNNLFNLLASIAFKNTEDGLVTNGPMTTENQLINLVTSVTALKSNLSDQEYYEKGLFSYLPGKVFPESFLSHLDFLSKKKPTESWLKEKKMSSSVSDNRKRTMYFGDIIKAAAEESSKYVINDMNIHWMDSFPSGYNATGSYVL